jgi:hypothetical protein
MQALYLLKQSMILLVEQLVPLRKQLILIKIVLKLIFLMLSKFVCGHFEHNDNLTGKDSIIRGK